MQRLFLTVAATLLLTMSAARAGDSFDGTADLVCATTRTLSCVNNFKCESGHPSDFNVPQFVTFRFAGEEIEMTYPGSRTTIIAILEKHRTASTLVTMGVIPDGGAYTFEIHRRKGSLFASGIQPEGFSFFIAGSCKTY